MHRLIRKPLVRVNNAVGRRLGYKLRKVPYSRPSTLRVKAMFAERPVRVLEIGCAAGNNALDILTRLNVSRYVVVDPYEHAAATYDDYTRGRLALMRRQATARLRRHADRIEWVYQTSSEAVASLSGPFDYIYVDGVHTHEGVLRDMYDYYPLRADRFVFGGHDVDQPEVTRAFVEFVAARSITNYEIKQPDWIIYGE
jgi:SAM-dependent methyltransferase